MAKTLEIPGAGGCRAPGGVLYGGSMTWVIIAQAVLWVWFIGCITTYRFGKILLVEGMGVRSAECVMLVLYALGLGAFHAYYPV